MKPILVIILAAAVFLIPVHYNTITKPSVVNEEPVRPIPLKQKIFILKAANKMGGFLPDDDENFLHEDLFFFKW